MKTSIRSFAIALLVANGLAALYYGGSMLADRSGAGLNVPAQWLDATPFTDFLVYGLVLVLVGAASMVTSAFTITGHRRSSSLIILLGSLLTLLVLTQAGIAQAFNLLHVVIGGIGFMLFGLGMMLADDELTVWNEE